MQCFVRLERCPFCAPQMFSVYIECMFGYSCTSDTVDPMKEFLPVDIVDTVDPMKAFPTVDTLDTVDTVDTVNS